MKNLLKTLKTKKKILKTKKKPLKTKNKKKDVKKKMMEWFGKNPIKKNVTHIRSKRGKGWADISKKLDRSKMPAKYFLLPKEKKFPVYTQTGQISCKAIQSAILRARILYSRLKDSKYNTVLKKAKRLLLKHSCNKV